MEKKKEKKSIRVVAAVIKDGERYFCAQRLRSRKMYESEKWEFPGGKVERGECDHEALLREMKEEMDIAVFVGGLLATVEHDYPDQHITLVAYDCRADKSEPRLMKHLDARWVTAEELAGLKWTEADRKLLESLGLV